VLGRVQAGASLREVRFAQPGHDLRATAGRGERARIQRAGRERALSLQVASFSIELIALLRPLVLRIRRYDRSLADQLVRAASSVALNIAEAECSDPGNKRARFFTAAGSANETLAALRVAVAWGYFPAADADAARALTGRVVAMLHGLTR